MFAGIKPLTEHKISNYVLYKNVYLRIDNGALQKSRIQKDPTKKLSFCYLLYSRTVATAASMFLRT